MAATSTWTGDVSDQLGEKLADQLPSSRSNALSNKLSNVLSSSYADPEIRDALRSLDDKKVRNTPSTRRDLRTDVQKDVIERNKEIIFDFGQVAQQLKRIGSTIDSLNECCNSIREQVAAARRDNAPLLEEADVLLRQREELGTKQQWLNAFNKHFVVLETDISTLTSTSEPVDDKFFLTLARMKKIRGECQVLLGSDNERLGTELLEQTSRHLNLGYQKLFRWVQGELRNLNLENPHISSIIRRALRALSEKPALFQGCLEYFAEARERVLTDSFYSALTGNAADDSLGQHMKPIEFHAHDPLRYVGDILAWTHSTTVSEREALENLFIVEGEEFKKGLKAGREAEPWSTEDSEAFDGQKALGDLVNNDMAGVAKALNQRIEQVLQNHEDALLLYKISNLVNFYHITLAKLLSPDARLLEVLGQLEETSLQHFRGLVSDNVAAINNTIPSDLDTPDFLDDALTQFAPIVQSYDGSLTPSEIRISKFEPILEAAFDPYMSACEKMSKAAQEPDNHLFMTNCLLAARSILAKHDFVQSRLLSVEQSLETRTSKLIDYQHAFFLHTSGLHPILAALAPLADMVSTPSEDHDGEDTSPRTTAKPVDPRKYHVTLIQIAIDSPALQPQKLSDAAQSLDDFLPSALMDAMENLVRLNSRGVAQGITAEAAERFCEDFEYVEGKLAAIDEARLMAKGRERRNRGKGEEKGGKVNGNGGPDLEADEDEDEDENGDGGNLDNDDEEDGETPTLLKAIYPRTSGEIRVLLS